MKLLKLVICLILICFFANSNLILAHNSGQHLVITANGFEPRELTIEEGSIVEFLNQDNQPRWPASDGHPTHTIYPEFDPKQPIQPGKSWNFRFDKIGTWRYHDHLLPHQRGVITVKSRDQEATSISVQPDLTSSPTVDQLKPKYQNFISQAMNLIEQHLENLITKVKQLPAIFQKPQSAVLTEKIDFEQLDQQQQFEKLRQISDQSSSQAAWKYLTDSFKGQSGTSGNIHDLAHFVGSLIYEQHNFPGLSICSSDFAFGCYHGFLDLAFSKSLADLKSAENGCLKVGAADSGPFSSCIHGIGHGIASFYLVDDLKGSLSSCEGLSYGQQFCFDGVFMEFARSAPQTFYQASDPLYPCNILEAKYLAACGRNQPNVLMSRFNFSYKDIIPICLESSQLDLKNSCFDALGFIAVQKSNGHAKAIIQDCNQITEELYQVRCLQHAAGELIFQNIPGWQQLAPQVCNSLANQNYTECHQYLQKIAADYQRV